MKLLASLLSIGAVTALFVSSFMPADMAAKLCTVDAHGNLVPYVRDTVDGWGHPVELKFDEDVQVFFCDARDRETALYGG